VARSPRFGRIWIIVTLALISISSISNHFALGQSSKSKSKPPKSVGSAESKQIDARLEKLQDTFANESSAIIESYEKAGQYEKAKFLLEVLYKLDPKNESLKKRISEMDDKMLERTEVDQKFNTGNDWTMVGTVEKDKPARVEAIGEYKLALTTTSLNADGFPSADVAHDLMGKIPTGALMGAIMTEANQKDKKMPEPFAIKSKHDFTPREDGELYLKINAPPGAKCIGDLRLKLNGIGRGNQ
jgi:tetratricopeptide (TPR) repeat protein